MGTLIAFAPWIVYWILVGNVPFHTAVLVALAVAIGAALIGRVTGGPGRSLEIGALATFVVLTILTFIASQEFMERWMQPLSNAGIFLVALIGLLAAGPSSGSSLRSVSRPGSWKAICSNGSRPC